MRSRTVLTLEDARRLMQGARACAEEGGFGMSIAVVDEAGVPLLLERLDNARLHTPDVAILKARTAAIARQSTAVMQEQVKTQPAYLTFPDRLPLQGGLPITYEGAVVGGIGVSGGKPEQDELVCRAGLEGL